MTMIDDIEMICSVCGKSSPQPVLLSTNAFGYPDLDFRPPSMQRETMNTWVHECPHCGYVSQNLADELQISKDFLKTDEYLTCDGHDFKGKLSGIFYRQYLIARQMNDTMKCFLALRNCAWKCDDYSDENSSAIRKKAIPYIDELIQNHYEDRDSYLLIKADFLRRSGEFEQVIGEYESVTFDDDVLNKIILFQIEKAKENDVQCYTVEDVVGR